MFPLAFVAGWLQGHWWGFISRNYVLVWPTFLLMNVFIALKGSHFWFSSVITRLPCRKSRLMRKPAEWVCAQRRLRSAWASTQSDQSLRCACPGWSESSLCAHWVAKDPSFLHADSGDSDQTGRMPRLIWVFAGRTATLLVFSWGGSNVPLTNLLNWGISKFHIFFGIFAEFRPNFGQMLCSAKCRFGQM